MLVYVTMNRKNIGAIVIALAVTGMMGCFVLHTFNQRPDYPAEDIHPSDPLWDIYESEYDTYDFRYIVTLLLTITSGVCALIGAYLYLD